jgi:hypothetical protein
VPGAAEKAVGEAEAEWLFIGFSSRACIRRSRTGGRGVSGGEIGVYEYV